MLPFVQRIAAGESTLEYGAFGKLSIYTLSDNPRNVVLFVSGDGGWNLGVVDMAWSLATLDALVVGIDITHYLKVLEQSKQAALASWNFMSATGSAGGVATESPAAPGGQTRRYAGALHIRKRRSGRQPVSAIAGTWPTRGNAAGGAPFRWRLPATVGPDP